MNLAKLAWRSLWRNRRRTLITVSSISMGLMLAVFFISLADGVYSQMTDDAVRMQAGHITLEHSEYRDAPAIDLRLKDISALRARIETFPGVERTKGLVLGQGVARSGSGAVGVVAQGVEPSSEAASSPLATHVIEGSYLEDGDKRKVLVGKTLAERLKLTVGKKIVLTTNDVHGEMVEELLRVKGIFEVGAEEVDAFFIQLPIVTARRVFGMEASAVTQLGVVVHEPSERDQILSSVQELKPEAAVLPWEEVMPALANYIRMDRGSNILFQGIILFLIGFTIFNTLLMSVLERKREFAVLLALGTPTRMLRLQIIWEAVFIAALGCGLGLFLGWGVSYPVQVWGIDLRMLVDEGVAVSGFAVDLNIHAKVTAELLAILGGAVFVATILMSLLTQRHATRVSITDVLR